MARFLGKIGFGEIASVAICLLAFSVPALTRNPLAYSLTNQILIAIIASYSIFVMLRMDLITFASPAFMAIGGYSAALFARNGVTEFVILVPLSFILPAVVAIPLGALVLRLRGVFFVLVTFVLSEILQLLLFETPSWTGGPNGLTNVPATTLFGVALDDNRSVLFLIATVALLATLIVATVTRYFRQHFAAIEENEVLAESLGLVVWHYKALGFVVSAGLAGMAGFALVNMLLTAHPSSFAPLASVAYITYTIVGGATSILGPVVGSILLVWASNAFSSQGEYSQGLFGLLIILVVVFAKGGIVGAFNAQLKQLRGRSSRERVSEKVVRSS
jgi:branched-chain amino acid transport system permease protein